MASPVDPLEWIVLDSYAHCTTMMKEDEEDDITASALGITCTGIPIRVSLRVADTPAISRLYLHVPPTWPDTPHVRYPTVLAAHRGRILFNAFVPFAGNCNNMAGYYPLDYFVYTAGADSPPSLTRLPPCFIRGGITEPAEDELFRPYCYQRQRTMSDRDVGILCNSKGGGFTVADLTFRMRSSAELCFVRQPKDTQWSIKHLDLPRGCGANLRLTDWNTDVVLPLHDRFLCWVDYFEGLLLVDILNSGNRFFRFIPLPTPISHVRRQTDIDYTTQYRSVSVTAGNNCILKLVCITTRKTGFTITGWTLANIHRHTWELDFKLESNEFWHCCDLKNMDGVVPNFPVVSLVHPGVVSFLMALKIDGENRVLWTTEVDMKNRMQLSCHALFIEEEEEEEENEELQRFSFRKSCRRKFCGEYFIPSQVTLYFGKNAIQSRLQSQLMQKAKMLTLTEKVQGALYDIGVKQKETLLSSLQEKLSSAKKDWSSVSVARHFGVVCVVHRLIDIYTRFYTNIGIDSSPPSSRTVYDRLDHPMKCTTTTHFFAMFVFKHVYYAIKLWCRCLWSTSTDCCRGVLLRVAPLSVDFSSLHRHGAAVVSPSRVTTSPLLLSSPSFTRQHPRRPHWSSSAVKFYFTYFEHRCRVFLKLLLSPLQADGSATSTSATDVAFTLLVLLLHLRLRLLHLVAYVGSSSTALHSSPATACCSGISPSTPFSRRDCLGGLLCWFPPTWRTHNDDDGEDDITASNLCTTCTGIPIRASLRVAATPAISRLYLHVPATWPDEPHVRYPTVLAAHRGRILFNAFVPFAGNRNNMAGYYPLDYFVYTANSPPSLTRLPPCFIRGSAADPLEDELYRPYCYQRQRTMGDCDVGILCHGGGFTVADLTFRVCNTTELCFVRKQQQQWTVKHLQLQQSHRNLRLSLSGWNTDAVLPIHDRFLCWVDYFEGLLIVDVLNPIDRHFRFIPLPKPIRHVRRLCGIGSTTQYRSVCVTENNSINSRSRSILKMVCVTTASGKNNRGNFTITGWTLANIHQNTWEMDFKVESYEFWDFCRFEDMVGKVPCFPVVSLVHPDVVSFLVMLDFNGENRLHSIEVDMKKRMQRSCPALYIEEEEEEEENEELQGFIFRKSYRRKFCGEYFIPSQVTLYFRKKCHPKVRYMHVPSFLSKSFLYHCIIRGIL
uniref:DUF1618 domain-containing protein n=1 Tax=Leersia perrieri TaxID=77586 RepID=A0A0D9VAH7_9ORYZ